MKILDLSYPMKEGDPNLHLTDHPVFQMIPIHRHAQHGRSNSGVRTSMHVGTHVDGPYHFHENAISIDQVPLEKLYNKGAIIDVSEHVEPENQITADVLQQAADKRGGRDQLKGKFLIVYTGWLDRVGYGTKDYYGRNPAFNKESAQWLVDSSITAVGLDCPPDFATPGGPRPGDSPVHRVLLGSGVPIVENLVRIKALLSVSEFLLCAVPVKIVGSDGALARAFAVIES
jgi:arylformamidase